MDLKEMNLRDIVAAKFGEKIFSEPFGSAIGQTLHGESGESQFKEIMYRALERNGKGFQHCVEIGTCCGISSIMLLLISEKISTFDILDTKIRHDIWKEFLAEKYITSKIVKNREEVREEILKLGDFDLAYVDGSHIYKDVVYDIETVESCGNIIFHDYDLYSKDHVMKAVHELICRRGGRFFAVPPFAYWKETI